MDTWRFTLDGFNPDEILDNGNRFLIGNGYMGCRGTMDEWGSKEFSAINLAGIYDQNTDKWREPVNAPNGLFAQLTVNGEALVLGMAESLEHSQSVHFRRGVHMRDTLFSSARIQSERIASMAENHLLMSRLTITMTEDSEAELLIGIVTDIWDINGPHLFEHKFVKGEILQVQARTGELDIPVAVAQGINFHSKQADFSYDERQDVLETGIYRKIRFNAKASQVYVVDIFVAVYTGKDCQLPQKNAQNLCQKALADGFESHLESHEDVWNRLWLNSEVELVGCSEAARAMNASLYHLHSVAPRHANNLSIPARGLSGQTYKGAVFWDAEIFNLPVFMLTEPELAKSLLRYRIETLPGALRKAAEYGYRGAFYPWESQEGGAEGCTYYNVIDVFTDRPVRTYFRDKQIHISGDVAYAFWRYYEITGDFSVFLDGGAEVILQCARFYLSRAHKRLDNAKIELLDVVGPDEYHERVDNNAFTNLMSSYCISIALKIKNILEKVEPEFYESLIKKLEYENDLVLLEEIYPNFTLVFEDGAVIEQFDGYFALEDCSLDELRSRLLDKREYWGAGNGVATQTQIIKQADVVAMMALFPERFSDLTVERNWDYYEPRTEHGSSLSACMYALTACRINRPDVAWDYFLKCASIDIVGGGKIWAGKVYIGGTHPAANGGAWIIAVYGFAGLTVRNGEISLSPRLPKKIESLRFPLTIKGKRKFVTVTHDGWDIEQLQT